jgi:hypothetical protein
MRITRKKFLTLLSAGAAAVVAGLSFNRLGGNKDPFSNLITTEGPGVPVIAADGGVWCHQCETFRSAETATTTDGRAMVLFCSVCRHSMGMIVYDHVYEK